MTDRQTDLMAILRSPNPKPNPNPNLGVDEVISVKQLTTQDIWRVHLSSGRRRQRITEFTF